MTLLGRITVLASLSIGISFLATSAVWAEAAGKCFWVHGRLSIYNGTPSLRIWPIGSKRLLGLCEALCGDTEDGPPLPANVKEVMPSGVSWSIRGEFEVCPLTKDRVGHMRYVRLKSAKRMHVTSGYATRETLLLSPYSLKASPESPALSEPSQGVRGVLASGDRSASKAKI